MIEFLNDFGFLNPLDGWFTPMTVIILSVGIVIIISSLSVRNKKWNKQFIIKYMFNKGRLRFVFYTFLYFLSGIIQQFALVFIYKFISQSYPDCYWNEAIASGIFSLLHFPNFLLMFATFGMAMVFLQHFGMYHNIYIIGIMHGFIANILKFNIPENIITSFTVWAKYIRNCKENTLHNKVKNKLYEIISKYLQGKDIGVIQLDSINVIGNNSLMSDMTFRCTESQNNAPDMIIEITSTETIKRDRYERYNLYEINSVKEYWIVDISNKTLTNLVNL